MLALTVGGNCPGLTQENPGLQRLVFGAIGLPTGLLMVHPLASAVLVAALLPVW